MLDLGRANDRRHDHAQLLQAPVGGLRQGGRDVQTLQFSKSVSAITSSMGTGVSANAIAELELTSGVLSGSTDVSSPGGVISTELSVTGFKVDGLPYLGAGEVSVSTNLAARQGVEGQMNAGSAAAQFSLIRAISSESPAFVNSFASQFR
jgi:hypothetical protein